MSETNEVAVQLLSYHAYVIAKARYKRRASTVVMWSSLYCCLIAWALIVGDKCILFSLGSSHPGPCIVSSRGMRKKRCATSRS